MVIQKGETTLEKIAVIEIKTSSVNLELVDTISNKHFEVSRVIEMPINLTKDFYMGIRDLYFSFVHFLSLTLYNMCCTIFSAIKTPRYNWKQKGLLKSSPLIFIWRPNPYSSN